MRTDVSRSLRDSPQFAGVSAGSNADVRSLPLAEVAIASILAAGLWALQTRSWRATELHMKSARFKSTSRASRIGGATRLESRPVTMVNRLIKPTLRFEAPGGMRNTLQRPPR